MNKCPPLVVISLNPAIDRIVEVAGLTIGAHQAGRRLVRQPAGKGINVARCLAKLGCESTVIGFLGFAEIPEFERFLTADGQNRIRCYFTPIAGTTRENITMVDNLRHNDTHIREQGPGVTVEDVGRLHRVIQAVVEPGSWVVLTGSMPPGMSTEQMQGLLTKVTTIGAKLIVDMAGDVLKQLFAKPPENLFLMKPNQEEFMQATSDSTVVIEDEQKVELLARELLRRSKGIEWTAVSMGAQGVVLVHKDKAWHGKLPLPGDQIRTTVGCGDAMLAGLIAGLKKQLPPEELLVYSLAIAGANAMALGAANFDASSLTRLATQATCIQMI